MLVGLDGDTGSAVNVPRMALTKDVLPRCYNRIMPISVLKS